MALTQDRLSAQITGVFLTYEEKPYNIEASERGPARSGISTRVTLLDETTNQVTVVAVPEDQRGRYSGLSRGEEITVLVEAQARQGRGGAANLSVTARDLKVAAPAS